MNFFICIVVMVTGAVVGSFLNVCILRIPAGDSIILPRSRCPRCRHAIRFYDNIPIVSYFILKGKCRDCAKSISPRYAAIEALTAVLFLLLFSKYGLSLEFLFYVVFTGALIVIAFIDLDHFIIPDVITLPGIPILFLAAVFVMKASFVDSILGVLIGGGSLLLIAVIYQRLTKREGIGLGDVKLLAMIGAFLGWKSLLFVLFLSSLLGSIVGLLIILRKGGNLKYAVPYGPFLSLAAVAYIFLGNDFMNFFIPT